MTTGVVTRSAPVTWRKAALRWLPTFAGFPLGAVAAELAVGRIDALAPALAGGAISGAVLGAVQSWSLGFRGPSRARWIGATAVGLSVGLAMGSAAVDYGTSLGELALQGAFCGLAVGAGQALVLRPLAGSIAYVWAPALAGLWALGWTITTSIGVDVDSQWTVFGSGGALVVTAATAVLPVLLANRAGGRS